jgi:zinc protease
VESYHENELEQFYTKWRDSGPWIIAAAGGMDPHKLLNSLEHALGKWKHSPTEQRSATASLSPRRISDDRPISLDKEQAHLAIGWRGIAWASHDRATLDVLMGILGGHGGRLFVKLRDQQSLAYTVSPLSHQGVEAGLVGAGEQSGSDQRSGRSCRVASHEQTYKVEISSLIDGNSHLLGANDITGLRLERLGTQISIGPRMCMHEGACLDGAKLEAQTLRCPWHGRKIKMFTTILVEPSLPKEVMPGLIISQTNSELVIKYLPKN